MKTFVLFAHGLNGSPKGSKATLLRNHFNAVTPSLQSLELPQQAMVLSEAMPTDARSVLIGSSLGALAALGAACLSPEKVGHLVLLAPAFDLDRHRETFADALVARPHLMNDAPAYAQLLPPEGIPCHVVQGMEDELFSIDAAVSFVQRVSTASLTLVHDDHQLSRWQLNLVRFVESVIDATVGCS